MNEHTSVLRHLQRERDVRVSARKKSERAANARCTCRSGLEIVLHPDGSEKNYWPRGAQQAAPSRLPFADLQAHATIRRNNPVEFGDNVVQYSPFRCDITW
jgi:hypothetical protein